MKIIIGSLLQVYKTLQAYIINPILFFIKCLFNYWPNTSLDESKDLKEKLNNFLNITIDIEPFIVEYKKMIRKYKYTKDKFFYDYINLDLRYIFKDLKSGRDCDDYSYLWKKWLKIHGKRNGYIKPRIYSLIDMEKKYGHAFTIVTDSKDNNKKTLFDYANVDVFEGKNPKETLNKIKKFVCKKYKYNEKTSYLSVYYF